MKITILNLLIALSLVLFVSCGGDGKEDTTPEQDTTKTEDTYQQETPVIEDTDETEEEVVEAEEESKEEAPAKTEQTQWKGKITTFTNAIAGSTATMSKSDIDAKLNAGQTFVLVSGGKVYFLFNADGTFASRKVSGYATSNEVLIVGKAKSVGGVMVIIIDEMNTIS